MPSFLPLRDAAIPELPNHYRGKVRENYDLPDGRRIIIATDRLSAFDVILTSIPFKGQVLTQTARYWFEKTADICPNHVIDYPDPNVVVGTRLDILPVEIVVRGYLAGTTSTSILTKYRHGERDMYGFKLPDGLQDNEELPQAIITPTSKAFDGGHDEPLSAADILSQKLLTENNGKRCPVTPWRCFSGARSAPPNAASFSSIPNMNLARIRMAASFSPTRSTRPTAAATGLPRPMSRVLPLVRGRRASTRISSEPG